MAESQEGLGQQKYVWDSVRIESVISVAVPYKGKDLKPETCYVWKVHVWDKDGNQLESSEEAKYETGLTEDDWDGALWIGTRFYETKSDGVNSAAEYHIQYDVRLGETKSGFL